MLTFFVSKIFAFLDLFVFSVFLLEIHRFADAVFSWVFVTCTWLQTWLKRPETCDTVNLLTSRYYYLKPPTMWKGLMCIYNVINFSDVKISSRPRRRMFLSVYIISCSDLRSDLGVTTSASHLQSDLGVTTSATWTVQYHCSTVSYCIRFAGFNQVTFYWLNFDQWKMPQFSFNKSEPIWA